MIGTLVILGNATQPFGRLLDTIVSTLDILPAPVLSQHGHTPLPPELEGVDFVSMDQFSEWVKSAEILIMHAGAGSVIHAVRAGKIPIVMPRRAELGEHVNNHQFDFSRAMKETGKVRVAEDETGLRLALNQVEPVQKKMIDDVPLMPNIVKRILREHEATIAADRKMKN